MQATGGAVETHEVDWEATAVLLLERIPRPAFLIDGEGVVITTNSNLSSLLGSGSARILGMSLDRGLPAVSGDWQLERALRGSVREFECRARGERGTIRMSGELTLVGAGGQRCLIAIAKHHRAERASAHEARYVVSRRAAPGRLLRVFDDAVELDADARCYNVLHGRGEPCRGCPILLGDDPGAASVVKGDVGARLVSGQAVDDDTVEVRALRIDDDLMSSLMQARVEAMSDDAGLTDREREVLQLVLLARSAEDISGEIGISPRTVKFHQSNLLAKLGAESRVDLLRLLV